MSYVLRLIQQYHPSHIQDFFELEAQFQALERRSPQFPRGRRYQPFSGAEQTNTLVWECEFDSLAEVQEALKKMDDDPTHTALFEKQAPCIVGMRTEIYKVLDL